MDNVERDIKAIYKNLNYQHDLNCRLNSRLDVHTKWLEDYAFYFRVQSIMLFVVVFFLAVTWCFKADAQEVKIQNKCVNSVGWDCYNKSQGAKNPERLAVYKKAKQGLKLKPRTKVILVDPKRQNGDYIYGAKYYNGVVRSAIMPGCFDHSVEWTRDALIDSLTNEYSNFGRSNFSK